MRVSARLLFASLLGLSLALAGCHAASDDDDSSASSDGGSSGGALPWDGGTTDAAHAPDDAGGNDAAIDVDAAVTTPDAGSLDAATAAADAGACNFADLGDPDRPRIVLVSHGYDADGNNRGHVVRSLSLPPAGMPVDDGVRLDVGVRVKRLAFVPSGAFALALGEDGDLVSVKVNSVDDMAVVDSVTLPAAGYGDLVVAADGRTVHAAGSNVDETSGISTVSVGCDGQLTVDTEAFFTIRLAESLALVPGSDRAVLLGGQAVFDPVDANDVRLLRRQDGRFAEIGAFDVYTDMVSAGRIGLSPDGTMLLVPNGSPFSDQGNQVAVLSITDTTITESLRLTDVAGPSEALFSPDGATALLSLPESNAVLVLARSGTQVTKGAMIRGIGLADQMAMVSRGSLAGLVLVASIDTSGMSNVARVRFTGPGVAEDQGQTNLGDTMTDIPDAIAVMP